MFCGDSCKNRGRVNVDGKRFRRGHLIKSTNTGEELEPNCAQKAIRLAWRTIADSTVGFRLQQWVSVEGIIACVLERSRRAAQWFTRRN